MLTTQSSSLERRIVRLFKHLLYSMTSPWQCPIPVEENTTDKVAIYFYKNDRWVPIMFYKLEDAIAKRKLYPAYRILSSVAKS